METLVCSIEETEACAEDFIQRIGSAAGTRTRATVVGLSGELGAGKTAFVKAAAKTLGVSETVTSPTFVIEKIYKLQGQPFEHLIHIDAYRLDSADELRVLGWDDIVREPGNLIFIEWPERVSEIVPDGVIPIDFTVVSENERRVAVKIPKF